MSKNADSDTARRQLREKLAELRGKPHLPETLISVVGETSLLQLEARGAVSFGPKGRMLPESARARVAAASERAQGKPALPPTDFPLDLRLAGELIREVFKVLEVNVPFLTPHIRGLEDRLRKDADFMETLCRAVPAEFAGDEAASACLREWAETCPEAPGLLRFAAQSAIMPSLETIAELLGHGHDNRAAWSHGHCPICAGPPLIGRLTGDGGARRHVCSFCSFEYRAPRTDCPFCLAPLADGANYYASPEEPGYSIAACPACRNYLKLADFRSGDRVWMPRLDDLGSLALDFYASSEGYTRPTSSAWGF